MKKIAILGCENSHAASFLKLIAQKEEFSDVEVIGVFSEEREMAEKMRDKFSVPILENLEDAAGKIDGLMITARHGENHFKYAKPYLDSKIPMFIDKPITICEEEAVLFMEKLKEKGIAFSGGSSLRHDAFVKKLKEDVKNEVDGKTVGGYIRAPYQKDSKYGGFYFYAQHLVEMMGEIFGRYPLSVMAKETDGNLHVLFHYENYDCIGFYCNEKYVYFASRMAENAVTSFDIEQTDDWFYQEFSEFYELLSGKECTTDHQDFIAPVFVMNAIERSLKSGKEEKVHEFEIKGE